MFPAISPPTVISTGGEKSLSAPNRPAESRLLRLLGAVSNVSERDSSTALGMTAVVVIGHVPDDEGAFYTFSARPASRKERRYYETVKETSSDE